jgi:hypothetical protein
MEMELLMRTTCISMRKSYIYYLEPMFKR